MPPFFYPFLVKPCQKENTKQAKTEGKKKGKEKENRKGDGTTTFTLSLLMGEGKERNIKPEGERDSSHATRNMEKKMNNMREKTLS